MALSTLGLGFIFTARDLASGAFGRLSKSFADMEKRMGLATNSMTDNLKRLGMGLATVAAGAGLLAGALAFAKPAGDFTYEVAKVGAISMATADDLDMLRKAAIDAGIATKFSPLEAAQGLGEFASQGINAADSAMALVPALNLASAGNISVAESAQAMTSALKVFSIDVAQSGVATDKLLKIANLTSLQARDLSLALGTVGRGASATKQSLDEMLISMGLVKNTGVDASVAASSVSSALLFVAQNAQKFKAMGVNVADAQGEFRPFIDIVQDTERALGNLTATERVAKATKLFGRFGLTAYSALSTQIAAGVKDAEGNLLRGTAAVEHLRKSMAGAQGTAEEFNRRLLSTFKGQGQILGGVFQTLAIVIGEPFERAFAPIVSGIAKFIEGLIRIIERIPAPVKEAAARFTVFTGAVLLTVGVVIALKAALAILLPFVAAAMLSLGGLALASVKFLVIGGLLGGMIYAVAKAFGLGFGDIADGAGKAWDKLGLFFDGVKQLFGRGYFSGSVLKELDKVENKGIQQFIVKLYMAKYRLGLFVDGVKAGFRDMVATLGPAFANLRLAWAELSDALGIGARKSTKAIDGMMPAGQRVGEMGRTVGESLGQLIGLFARLAAVVIKAATWIVDAFKWLSSAHGEAVDYLADGIGDTVTVFKHLASDVAPYMQKFADVVMTPFRWIRDAFNWLVDGIRSAITGLQDLAIETIRMLPDAALPEQFRVLKPYLMTSGERADRENFRAQPIEVQRAVNDISSAGPEMWFDLERSLARVASAMESSQVGATGGGAGGGQVVLAVDGVKMGEVVANAQRGAAERAFDTIPVLP